MSWRERLAFVGRVLTWRARINRTQFGVFFGLLYAASMVVMAFGMGALMASAPNAGAEIFEPAVVLPPFGVLFLLMLCLFVARARDIGWSALVPVLVFAPTVALLPTLVVETSFIPHPVRAVLIPIGAITAWVMLPLLAVLPSRKAETKWGAPMAGLWGAL